MSEQGVTNTLIRIRPASRVKADAIVSANPDWSLAQAVDAALSEYIAKHRIKTRKSNFGGADAPRELAGRP
jgi:hypothetical protein